MNAKAHGNFRFPYCCFSVDTFPSDSSLRRESDDRPKSAEVPLLLPSFKRVGSFQPKPESVFSETLLLVPLANKTWRLKSETVVGRYSRVVTVAVARLTVVEVAKWQEQAER